MKANEMPERIYLFDYNDAMVTPLEGDTVYVREDAFIKRACAWLKENKDKYLYNTGEKGEYIPTCTGKMIEDFRKYLQEEPVSEKKCMFTKDSYTDEDRKVLCEDCKEKCEYSKKEEPVSEVLDEAAFDYAESCKYEGGEKLLCVEHFKAGAKWHKEHLWKPADGDDLPEIDREVVAFQEIFPTDVDVPSLLKIVIAHRPNTEGYDGKSITTGQVEHYTPKTYDKGGWNIPDVKYWLDARLPYEENKIDKLKE